MAINIDGLTEITDQLPDDRWYVLKILIRKVREGEAQVRHVKELEPVEIIENQQ